SDDQVGMGQVRCIEMASYSLGCDTLDHIGQRCSFPRLQLDEATDSIGDLLPPSVPNCNRQCHQIVLRSRRLGRTNRRNDRLGKEVEATDRLYPDAFLMHEGIVSKRGDFGFDRRKDSGNLRLSSLEVLGLNHPQWQRGDTPVGAPVQDIVEPLGATLIDFTWVAQASLASMAAIAIQDDANVARHRPALELIKELALVKPIKKTQEQRCGGGAFGRRLSLGG